jgi:ribosomal protein L21
MRNFRLILIFLSVFSLNGFAQITESDWEKVIVTRNSDDVKGLKRAGDVSAETSKLYGKQSKLREETTIKIKKEAAKIGASIVLISVDEFAMTPINNVNMVGVAYFQDNLKDSLTNSISINTQTITETDWEKVIVTRNKDEIAGYTRVGDLSAETSRLYGKQSKLREETTIKIKMEAAKIGASIVLISVDEFAMTPINNVYMVGVAYRK